MVFLAGTKCAPGLDEKLNNWYNGTCVPMLLKSQHLEAVIRYKLAPVVEGEYPPYLAIYEFKERKDFEAWMSGPEVLAAHEEAQQTWADGGFEVPWLVPYEPLKTWHKIELDTEPVKLVVGTQCRPDDDEKFNNWYNETHIPMLLESEHVVGATRYKITPGTEGEYPAYLALYNYKNVQAFEKWYSGPEIMAARKEKKETWVDDDFEGKWIAVYEPLKTWRK